MRRMRWHSGNLIIARDLKAQREPTFSGECWRLSASGSSYWHWTGGWAPSAWPFGSWRLSPEAFRRCSDELYSPQTSSYRSWSPPHQPLEMTQTLCRGWARSMPPLKKDLSLRTQMRKKKKEIFFEFFKFCHVVVLCKQTCKGPCSPPVNSNPSLWWHMWREGQGIST